LATETINYRSNGSDSSGRLSRPTVRKLRNVNRSKYTPAEKRAFSLLSEPEKAAARAASKAQEKSAGKKSIAVSATTSDKRVCYKCNKPGHIARECREKIDPSEQKISMLIAEGDYLDYDRYEDCGDEDHQIFVTRKVTWADDLEDSSSIESNNNTCINLDHNKPVTTVVESLPHPSEACLLVREDEDYSVGSVESRNSMETRDLLTSSKGALQLTKVQFLPSVEELKQQLDFVHQEKVFMSMGGGHNLVRCEGILEENGPFDIRSVPIERIIDNWQDLYLKDKDPAYSTHTYDSLTNSTTTLTSQDTKLPERAGTSRALGPYAANKEAEINVKINAYAAAAESRMSKVGPSIKPAGEKGSKVATKTVPKATTVGIPFHPRSYPPVYNTEDYKSGQKWIF
jgi:hypothetical protein